MLKEIEREASAGESEFINTLVVKQLKMIAINIYRKNLSLPNDTRTLGVFTSAKSVMLLPVVARR